MKAEVRDHMELIWDGYCCSVLCVAMNLLSDGGLLKMASIIRDDDYKKKTKII